MRNPDTRSELEAYLRLNHATSGEWLHGLRQLLGCANIDCDVQHSQAMLGSLSALETNAGVICVLNVAQEMELGHCQLGNPLLVMPIGGRCEATLAEGTRLPVVPLAIIPAEKNFTLTIGEGSQLVLLLPNNTDLPRWPDPGLPVPLSNSLLRFLSRSDYFQSHQHACAHANDLFEMLEQLMLSGQWPGLENDAAHDLDRRLVRGIEKMRCEPEWSFNLQELASHSGVSERNLYYLMKRETGMTPYRFYQRCRLIRVRRRLVDCQCDIPHISWYAADEGFSHLGRFSALYREHFGELPSETVQWRRRLQALEGVAVGQAAVAV